MQKYGSLEAEWDSAPRLSKMLFKFQTFANEVHHFHSLSFKQCKRSPFSRREKVAQIACSRVGWGRVTLTMPKRKCFFFFGDSLQRWTVNVTEIGMVTMPWSCSQDDLTITTYYRVGQFSLMTRVFHLKHVSSFSFLSYCLDMCKVVIKL